MVGPDASPPDSVDPLEDWIRLPAEDRELVAESLSQLFSLDWPTPGL